MHIRRTSLADVGSSPSIFGRRCSSSKSRRSTLITTVTDPEVPVSLLWHGGQQRRGKLWYGDTLGRIILPYSGEIFNLVNLVDHHNACTPI